LTEIYGIQLMFQVRERITQKIFLDEIICLKFPTGSRLITGWGRCGKDNDFLLCADVKTIVVDRLMSHDTHTQQKIGTKVIESLKGVDWFCDACVLDVTNFEKVTQLESWYEHNSKSSLDKFLNEGV
jgi:hypothetical protein